MLFEYSLLWALQKCRLNCKIAWKKDRKRFRPISASFGIYNGKTLKFILKKTGLRLEGVRLEGVRLEGVRLEDVRLEGVRLEGVR